MKPIIGTVANVAGITQSGNADVNPAEAAARPGSPRRSRTVHLGGLSGLFKAANCALPRTVQGAAPGPSRAIPAIDTPGNTTIANLSIAREVLKDIRTTYYKSPNFKSSNKWRTKVDQELEVARLKAASASLSRLRGNSLRNLCDIENATAHNCGELSRLAMERLSGRNVKAAHIVIGGSTIAHAFAAILPYGCAEQKIWERDMSKWDEGIIICDPWLNIACPAPEFNRRLIEKLTKWDEAGKRISHEGQWLSANDEKLRDAIVAGEKRTRIVSSPPRVQGFHIK